MRSHEMPCRESALTLLLGCVSGSVSHPQRGVAGQGVIQHPTGASEETSVIPSTEALEAGNRKILCRYLKACNRKIAPIFGASRADVASRGARM